MQWTHEEMLAQPLSYVYELAADAQLENEASRAESPTAYSSAGQAGGRQRIIRYTLRESG